jgi:hypothetical protein
MSSSDYGYEDAEGYILTLALMSSMSEGQAITVQGSCQAFSNNMASATGGQDAICKPAPQPQRLLQ